MTQSEQPTAAEIRRQCRAIQRGWGKHERHKRAPQEVEARRVEVRQVSVADAREAARRIEHEGR